MNKQIILEQCDKIKNVVTEATQNEEEARNNAEKFKCIKEENTKLLDLLNKTKDIYWEMELRDKKRRHHLSNKLLSNPSAR